MSLSSCGDISKTWGDMGIEVEERVTYDEEKQSCIYSMDFYGL